MSRILLLLAQQENRRLLGEALHAQGHGILWPESSGTPGTDSATAAAQLLAGAYDLCILDTRALDRLEEEIRTRRRAEAPLFLPFLLISPRQAPAIAGRYLPETVDEWLSTPVQKVELRVRVETLLRLRRLSQEAAEKARLEGVLLAARTLEHEVSNKLVATAGYTERLAANPALPPELRERAARAHQGAKEAADIIRQVLALTETAGRTSTSGTNASGGAEQRQSGLPLTNWGETGGTTIDISAA